MITRNKPYMDAGRVKNPTIKHDAVAYEAGGKKTFDAIYTTYLQSVETIDLAVRTIANIISLCKMDIVTKGEDGKYTSAKIDNIDLNYPNETDSRVDFLRKLSATVFTQGAGLIITESNKRGKRGKMINFYNIDVAKIEAVSDGKSLIKEFVYTAENGEKTTYASKDCIYINDSIDPSNLIYSLSRLKSLNDVILMQAGAVGLAKGMLTGGAKKSAIISAESPISSRNMGLIKSEFDSFMQSPTSSSFFMNTKLDVQMIGNSMTGTEVLELFTQLNKTILKHFSIPQFLLGEASNGANKTEELTNLLRIFFSSQLLPVLTNMELQFTRFFQEQLGLLNLEMKFDYSDLDILKMPEEVQVDLAAKKHKAGLITLNEARQMLEMPPLDGEAANKVYMASYLLGSAPISYNDYDTDLERYMNVNSVSDTAEPNGNAGGEDNESVVDSTRGGPTGD